MTREETLRSHEFTKGMADRHVAELAALATEVNFDEGEVVLGEGQRSQYFYLVLAGSVSVELHTAVKKISMASIGPGQVFGWSAVLDQPDTRFQVRARERTRALRIAGADLSEAFRKDSELGVAILLRMLRVIAGRVNTTEAKFAEM